MAAFNDYDHCHGRTGKYGVNDFDIRGAALAATTQILAIPSLPEGAESRNEANWGIWTQNLNR